MTWREMDKGATLFLGAAVLLAAFMFIIATTAIDASRRAVGRSQADFKVWHLKEFCKRAEALNPGWRCPDPGKLAADVWRERKNPGD